MTTLGPYTNLCPLGCGAMSDVFAARDSRSGRPVALKIARSGMEARLRDEARMLGRIRHPGVVRTFEHGVCEGVPWLSMERLRGVSLRQWSTSAVRDAPAMTNVFDQLTAAVDAVHRAGVIHRDIKPDNVFVCANGRVCLLDFGLAVESGAPARERATAGTPLYMAPELLEGREATPASDQYALAASLFETLSGRLPFRAKTLEELGLCIAAGVPTRPLARASAAVRADIIRALQRSPEQRFPSVAAFGSAVVRHARVAAPERRAPTRLRTLVAKLFQPRLTPAYG